MTRITPGELWYMSTKLKRKEKMECIADEFVKANEIGADINSEYVQQRIFEYYNFIPSVTEKEKIKELVLQKI